MKTILTLFCVLFLTSSAYANGDLIENVFGDNYVYTDNRHKTVVKKVYPTKVYHTKTVVKEVVVPVKVPVAVGVPAEIVPPVAQTVVRPVTMQVGRQVTTTVPVAEIVAGTPVAVVTGEYVPVCRMIRSSAVVDQFGNVLDYVYTRVCN